MYHLKQHVAPKTDAKSILELNLTSLAQSFALELVHTDQQHLQSMIFGEYDLTAKSLVTLIYTSITGHLAVKISQPNNLLQVREKQRAF